MADHARIAHLERWHARQDCADHGGHTLPEGYIRPTPADLADYRETINVSAHNDPNREIPILTGLPDHVAETPCTHCGDTVLATTPEEAHG